MGSEAQSTNFFQETEIWTGPKGVLTGLFTDCLTVWHEKSRLFTGFSPVFWLKR
jgi:hypothetical protein